ncbi:unnamed protein product [Caenorhabditis brenneri]
MFRPFLLLLTVFAVAETCVPTVAPDEYYPTSTLPPYEPTTRPVTEETTTEDEEETTVQSTTGAAASMCDQCDINDIAPDLDATTTEFYIEVKDPVDGCLRTYASCRRIDNLICTTVQMFAETPTGTEMIGDGSTSTVVFATFSCADDGTYSWMSVTEISKLTCVWDTCF